MRTKWLAIAVLAACAPEGGVAGAADAESYAAIPQVSGQASAQLDESRATAIVRAASRVAPAVVSVNVISTQVVQAQSMWESFFVPPGAERRSASFGSGVIVRADGIIVTNNHVIEGADRIQVTLPGGRDVEAELVGTDPLADIAVLRIAGTDLPVAPIGSVDGLMIGEWAVAIGNPLGNYVGDTQPTVTAGVISAVGRNISPSAGDEGFYLGMIQTDAAINPWELGRPPHQRGRGGHRHQRLDHLAERWERGARLRDPDRPRAPDRRRPSALRGDPPRLGRPRGRACGRRRVGADARRARRQRGTRLPRRRGCAPPR